MASWRPRLIPRKTYQGRRMGVSLDAYGLPTDDAPVLFDVENASAQPLPSNERMALQEGYRNKRCWRLFTTTTLTAAEEGSTSLGDQVEINGHWCDIIRVDDWDVGVQTHYEAICVEENER